MYYASTSDGRDWKGPFSCLQTATKAAERIAKQHGDGECLITQGKEPVGCVSWDGESFECEMWD